MRITGVRPPSEEIPDSWSSEVEHLLFVGCRDEEGVGVGVLVVSDLDDELWDAQANVVEKPE